MDFKTWRISNSNGLDRPTESTLEDYLESIERMKEASTSLEKANYKATERAVIQLVGLESNLSGF